MNHTKANPTVMASPSHLETDFTEREIYLESSSLVSRSSTLNKQGEGGTVTSYGTLECPGHDDANPDIPSLVRVLMKLMGPRLILGLLMKMVADGFSILSPVILGCVCEYSDIVFFVS